MRFPKDRNGFSPQGNKDARFIDESRVPFLTRRRPATAGHAGFVARKKGEFLEVRLIPQLDAAAYYAIGDEGATTIVRASATARGQFINSGALPSAFGIKQLVPVGNGKALTITTVSGPTFDVTDIAARSVWRTTYKTLFTTNGLNSTDRVTVDVIAATTDVVSFESRPGQIVFAPGTYSGGKWSICFAFDSTVGNQNTIKFCRDDGTTAPITNVDTQDYYMLRLRGMQRCGPSQFLVLSCGFMFNAPIGWPHNDNTLTPVLTWTASSDNGATWTRLTPPAFIEEEMILWRNAAANFWLTAEQWAVSFFDRMALYAFPLNQGQAVISLWFPLLRRINPLNPYGAGNIVVHGRVVRGLYNFATGSITELGRDDFASAPQSHAHWERGGLSVPGGVLHFITTDVSNYKIVPFNIYFTPTGGPPYTLVDVSPAVSGIMGVPTMISPTQIECPIFDGTYSLYESTDRGAIWTKRATISPDTATPSLPAGSYIASAIRNFGVLAYLRSNGVGANPTPGTPWASDSRIAFA